LEYLAASSFRAKMKAAEVVSYHNTTWHHNPDDLDMDINIIATHLCRRVRSWLSLRDISMEGELFNVEELPIK
jgi:hypothetical protein